MKLWLDGRLVDVRKASVSPLDRGLLYGDGLFETLRAYRGVPFLLDEHLARLEESARAIELPVPGRGELRRAVEQVLAANNLLRRDARVRVTVTRGRGGGELWPEVPPEPTLLVTAQPVALPDWFGEGRGAAAVVGSARVLSGGPHLKSTSFQPHVLARGEARRKGAWEALLLNERGEVAEGAASNVFVARGREVVTPPPEAGILPGITRAAVLRLAPALGLRAREAALRPGDVLGADEAFLTSSVAEVVPLASLDGRALGAGAPGPVARRVWEAYRAEVERVAAAGKPIRSDSVK